jgi:hypothetical protein
MHSTLAMALGTWMAIVGGAAEPLPVGSAPTPIGTPHFPSRLHAFVWRNWECCNLDRMAQTVEATPEQIAEIGSSMGLPKHQPISDDQLARSYITIIRRNWHLLPYDQLLTLLGWDADRLAYTLREDDFLWVKLGNLKPKCEPLKYAAPDQAALDRCAEIKALVEKTVSDELANPAVARFAFVHDLSAPLGGAQPALPADADHPEPIRFLYSYFALYGDPLLDDRLNPYPDGLLQRLRQAGVNGVWMHVVLRQLAPAKDFPEFGEGSAQRLANLRKLVERAGQQGVKIYLYMNEPRAMTAPFFANRPDMKGVAEGEYSAMCTSNPAVRQWITDALRHVFSEVPGLGGVFTITGSENLTNCWSHYGGKQCPRCSKREPADVIAEINTAIAQGVREGSNGKATTIAWDWGWQNAWCDAIIAKLPKDVHLMSVSEWDLPITRGGVSTTVGEYSLSAVGPGPRAKHNWEVARKAGLKTVAKIQANCSWELSAVPYLPVMNLVAQHCANRASCGVEGTMLSWTLGGYPSPNLELVNMFSRQPAPTVDEALHELAKKRYGRSADDDAVNAWTAFSKAFSEFPYHGSALYNGPLQVGPANLLYAKPTGYQATMVGFPYDNLDGWRAVYPANVYGGQLRKVADGWRQGLGLWDDVVNHATAGAYAMNARTDARRAEAALLHFQSAANQVDFILARDAKDNADRQKSLDTMRTIAEDEIKVAQRMFALARQDSTLGYEASNHYNYFPFDLVEKIVNCQFVLDELKASQEK